MGTRVPIQAECQERARQAGHRHAQVQNGYFCERVLLARARRMPAVCDAEDQHGILAGKD